MITIVSLALEIVIVLLLLYVVTVNVSLHGVLEAMLDVMKELAKGKRL